MQELGNEHKTKHHQCAEPIILYADFKYIYKKFTIALKLLMRFILFSFVLV